MEKSLDPHMQKLLDTAIERNSSDLHLTVGVAPTLRIDGKLTVVPGEEPLTAENAVKLIESIMTDDQLERLKVRKEVDFSFGYRNMRYRTNTYYQKGFMATALRLIPKTIKNISIQRDKETFGNAIHHNCSRGWGRTCC